MIYAFGLQFVSSPLRIVVPAMVVGTTALLFSALDQEVETAMEGSSLVATVALIWVPVAVLASSIHGRAAGIASAHLALSDRRSQCRHASAVVLSSCAWLGLGWIAMWAGASQLVARTGPRPLWVMALGGLSLTLIAITIGLALAASKARLWTTLLAAGGTYLVLAIWNYLPQWPPSIAFSVYGSLFFVEALPTTPWLVVQFLWAIGLITVLVMRRGRVISRIAVPGVVVAGLVLVTAAGASLPPLSPRDGRMALDCAPVGQSQLCLWRDLVRSRDEFVSQVTAAADLVGGEQMPEVLVTQDLYGTIPSVPTADRDARVAALPATTRPRPREIVGLIVGGTIAVPDACPEVTFEKLPGTVPADVVAEIAETGSFWAPDGTQTALTDNELVVWLSAVRRSIADCQAPQLP